MSAHTPRSGADEYRYSFLPAEEATLLADRDYLFYLLDRIQRARSSIWAAIFIVDVHPARGGAAARRILDALGRACWSGLDVRVVIGRSRQKSSIDLMDRLSFRYLRARGIPVRVARPPSKRRSSLHSKYAIFDGEEVLLGSHNWAYFDLIASRQCSVAVRSPHLARRLGKRFDELWDASEEAFS